MFRMSYRFMARPTVQKGAVKVAKATRVHPPRATAQPAASILNAPIAPPLEITPPKMPSLDVTSLSRTTATSANAVKPKTASHKKSVKKPSKKPGKAAKVTKTSLKKAENVNAKPSLPKLGLKKPMKLKAGLKKKAKHPLKTANAAKTKVSKSMKVKPKQK